MRLLIIGSVEGMPLTYTRATRLAILTGEFYILVWLTNQTKLNIAYEKAKEHAYWLVGDKHPAQTQN